MRARKRRSSVSLLSLSLLCACSVADGNTEATADGDAEFVITPDVIYGHKLGLAMTLDVYQPRASNGAGIIIVNSGGYRSPYCRFHVSDEAGMRLLEGTELDEAPRDCRQLGPRTVLESGFTVFVLNHGAYPRFLMPEIMSDVRRGVRAVRRDASSYGVDPDRIGVWGGSAGGHLSLALGLGSEISAEAGADETGRSAAPMSAVVAYFPVADWELYEPGSADVDRLLDGQRRDMSPIGMVSPDDPPTLIVHGDQDALVPLRQGQLIHEALSAVGVTSRLIVLEGAPHGFTDAFADRALAESLAWFREHLLN